MINTVLDERFAMANMIRHANLEIERTKANSDQVAEGFRLLKQSRNLLQDKLQAFEVVFLTLFRSLEAENRYTDELNRLSSVLAEMRLVLTSDMKSFHVAEPTMILGDIHGSDDRYLRLQSAFRALQKEN